jgi:hypothetical protein
LTGEKVKNDSRRKTKRERRMSKCYFGVLVAKIPEYTNQIPNL